MKKLLISILFLVTFALMMHLSGLFRFSQMFDHANATRVSQERLPIIDTHVHYKEPAWEVYPPDVIINLLKKTGVVKALVSSTPDEGTRMLYKEDPERIIPFLRPYHDDINSSNWYLKDQVFSYILKRLEMPIYKGIGEFHIHNPIDADRITIGSDTWINAQWDNYEAIIAFDRNWLAQLPDKVARQIAFENAKRLFDR
jgi:hypothetical protein